jgi:hypothetical protein
MEICFRLEHKLGLLDHAGFPNAKMRLARGRKSYFVVIEILDGWRIEILAVVGS